MRVVVVSRWFLPFVLLLTALVVVPLRIFDEKGLPRYATLKDELHKAKQQTSDVREQVRALQRHVEALRSDPNAIEAVARQELGLVKRDEIVFQFEE